MRGNMVLRRTVVYLCISYCTIASANLFTFDGIRSYTKYLDWDTLGNRSSGNELWNGIMKDCSRKMTFSCIQKNAYTYLDNTFIERDNITVFEGLVLRRNDLDYETMTLTPKERHNVDENLIESTGDDDPLLFEINNAHKSRIEDTDEAEMEAEHREEYKSPLEEITGALRDKTVKFLATRDYELQLPEFFFEGSTVKISPREIDEKGALIRVDFGQRGVEEQGRLLFKRIRKFIQNKLLMSFLALLLIIKLIKVKFMFIIPFLFGIGTAKKLFLKLLLFLVPAFAHIFKLCSSYYTSHSQKYHHHHHQVAHHHHHVPVPVPVPTYFSPHRPPHHEEEYEGYEYGHPHIQLRKDMDELKEWGIETNEDLFDDPGLRPVSNHAPLSPVYQGNPGQIAQPGPGPIPQPGPVPRPLGVLPYQEKFPANVGAHAQHLAYNGYVDEHKYNRRTSVQSPVATGHFSQVSQVPAGSINIQVPSPFNLVSSNVATSNIKTSNKTPYNVHPQQKTNVPQQDSIQQVTRPIQQVQTHRVVQQPVKTSASVAAPLTQSNNRVAYDDTFYGPILERLDDIFAQLRFVDENCRERLICSMYKNPALYSPHSNIVSNELSRDPQELKRSDTGSDSSQRFHRYLNAARLGQDGGDCPRTYPCLINTE